MNALNRHLKSETGVECARVVEREGRGMDLGVVWWEIWIVGWRQTGGGGADILFGVTLWTILSISIFIRCIASHRILSPSYEREKSFSHYIYIFLVCNLFMIMILLYLHAYK